jgi:hypothetical protein
MKAIRHNSTAVPGRNMHVSSHVVVAVLLLDDTMILDYYYALCPSMEDVAPYVG